MALRHFTRLLSTKHRTRQWRILHQGIKHQASRSLASNGSVNVNLPSGVQTFNATWLRENCRCPECYTHATEQRHVLFHRVSSCASSVEQIGERVSVRWEDGHQSTYDTTWLRRNAYPGPAEATEKMLWNGETMRSLNIGAACNYDEMMGGDDGVRKLLQDLCRYGFGMVSDVPVDEEETGRLASQVAFIQETLFGRNWTFTADLARGDTAYTNIALGAHTDTTYINCPAGIQVFHCLHHDGEGGETLLVDGFHVAERLRAQDPSAFNLLLNTPLVHEYKEPGIHVDSLAPVLSIDPTSAQLLRIKYNHYDRAPISTVPQDDVAALYSALHSLSQLVEDADSELWLKLRPGTVLFVDNWRVMHGRASFTGNRTITGCYLPRDDWISKARILNVL